MRDSGEGCRRRNYAIKKAAELLLSAELLIDDASVLHSSPTLLRRDGMPTTAIGRSQLRDQRCSTFTSPSMIEGGAGPSL
jgi:hypothetical protein